MRVLFPVALLPVVLFAGCANSCFVAISSPPNGTIGIVASDTPLSCPPLRAKSTLDVVMRTVPLCESCSDSSRIEDVLLTLKGIGLHPKAVAGEQSVDWQELFPEFEEHPLRIDLTKTTANELRAAEIQAGTYDQLRLRLVPDREGPEDEFALKNGCGAAASNCVIMADGRIQALLFDRGASELRISLESPTDGFLLISPDSEGELLIELTPVWSMSSTLGGELRLLPVLTGRARSELKSASVKSSNP